MLIVGYAHFNAVLWHDFSQHSMIKIVTNFGQGLLVCLREIMTASNDGDAWPHVHHFRDEMTSLCWCMLALDVQRQTARSCPGTYKEVSYLAASFAHDLSKAPKWLARNAARKQSCFSSAPAHLFVRMRLRTRSDLCIFQSSIGCWSIRPFNFPKTGFRRNLRDMDMAGHGSLVWYAY
jgi:hypothetical protein